MVVIYIYIYRCIKHERGRERERERQRERERERERERRGDRAVPLSPKPLELYARMPWRLLVAHDQAGLRMNQMRHDRMTTTALVPYGEFILKKPLHAA